jgi:hypothetical protein
VAAVLETFSRVDEQRFWYSENASRTDDLAVSTSGVARTAEAQKILSQPTKKKTKTEILDNKELLDDFFQQDEDQE